VVSRGAEMAAVIDGVLQPWYSSVSSRGIVLSSDGRHFAYAARKGDRWVVVFDGRQGPAYSSTRAYTPVFSPDGSRMAYVAGVPDGQLAVIDGRPGPVFAEIDAGTPTFSDDGAHVAYAARDARGWHIVADGVPSGTYDGIGALDYSSADGLVLEVFRGGKWFVLAGGRTYGPFDGLYPPTIGPAGHIAFVGVIDGISQVYIDGIPGVPALGVATASIRFSPDGDHVAYIAVDPGGRKMTVVDNQVVVVSNWVTAASPVFSLDGRHLAVGLLGVGRAAMAVDGRVTPEYDAIITGPVASGNGFQATAIRDGVFYRIGWEPPPGQFAAALP
jgi:hypothetical protein